MSRQGSAGLNVQVVQIGGSAKRDDTHTVKVKLLPLLSHDERVKRLQADPRWSKILKDSLEYTVKGAGDESQLELNSFEIPTDAEPVCAGLPS